MDKTEHFDLNQWESTDRILMEDFNGDNAKIDAALDTHTQTLIQLAAAMGNCSIYTRSYVGTGLAELSNATRMTFDKPPRVILITSDQGLGVFIQGDFGFAVITGILLSESTSTGPETQFPGIMAVIPVMR